MTRKESEPLLLLGTYRPPVCNIGDLMTCAVRGRVRVHGFTTAAIPWPTSYGGRWARGKLVLIVCGDLKRAIRRESVPALAHWFGVSRSTVVRWRRAIGVPAWTAGSVQARADGKRRVADALRGKTKVWTPAKDAILGTVNDIEAARVLGLPVPTMNRRRRQLGIARVALSSSPHPWTAAEDALLGTMIDRELAARLGITQAMVVNCRWLLKVPSFKSCGRRHNGHC